MDKLPLIEFDNLYHADPLGKKLWTYWLGENIHKEFEMRFSQMGKNAAIATPLSDVADKQGPKINNFNSVGERVDKISYHPAYTKLKKLSYEQEIISLKYDPNFLKQHKNNRHLIGFAIAYYFAQTETGLFCPICMTDALGRVLERHNSHPMAKKALKHIASPTLENLWEGAMFLTEKQGGSDVGANTVEAKKDGERWLLYGDKWFCSNADAKASLALARLPGEEGKLDKGTRGLGLFLVLRDQPENNHQTWLTHRLKEKLGVRSMASGEITFNGTEGFLIGGANEGFKIMAEMVNMSRLYNAISSIAVIRRAILEAVAFGKKRQAFGAKLDELPLWRSCAADLIAEHLGLQFLVFESIKQMDLADNGNEQAAKLVRLMTPLAKGLSAKLAVYGCSEGMELIGGNAYIEEHIMPRLLRDAQVLPIWEGTTNIQSLDVLRALQKEGPESYFARCELALSKAKSTLVSDVKKRVVQLQTFLGDVNKASSEDKQRASRYYLEMSGRILSLCLLLEATSDDSLKDICEAAAKRILARPYLTAPFGGCFDDSLSNTESILIDIAAKN